MIEPFHLPRMTWKKRYVAYGGQQRFGRGNVSFRERREAGKEFAEWKASLRKRRRRRPNFRSRAVVRALDVLSRRTGKRKWGRQFINLRLYLRCQSGLTAAIRNVKLNTEEA